jgi:MFS family permease
MSAPPSIVEAKLGAEFINPPPNETQATLKDSDAPSEESATPSASQDFNPGWRFVVAIMSLSTITLMAALDATSLSVALPVSHRLFQSYICQSLTIYLLQKMANVLNGTAIEAFWAGTSFLLTSTVFQPVMGSFSHIFGRKPMIMISLAFFVAGAIIAAVANNFTVILVGRAIQGTGGGGIICLSEIVITDLVPLRERGKWFSFLSAMWAVGTVAGPLLGKQAPLQ